MRAPAQTTFQPRLLIAILLVFGVAWALRVAHLSSLRDAWDGTQLFSMVRGDAAHHWREAQAILNDDVWLRDRVFWKGPGYSYLLAGLMKMVGPEPGALRWPFAFLGALNCGLLVWLVRRALPLGWSVAVGLTAALNGVVLLFDGELFFPTVLATLNLGVVALLATSTPSRRATLGAGALLGLSALVHPVYLLPAATLTVGRFRSRLRAAGWLWLGIAVLVLPLTARNLAVKGEPVLISWSGGVNLYIGNQPGFDQLSGQGTAAWSRVLETPLDTGLRSASEIDRTYLRLTLTQVTRHPGMALKILATKVWGLLSPVEIANNIRLYEQRAFSPVLRALLGHAGPLWWPFGILAPLALVGLWTTARRPAGPAGRDDATAILSRVLAWWSAGLVLSILLSFNTARYRAPLMFFASYWGVLTVHGLWQEWRTHDRAGLVRRAGAGLAIVVAIAALARPQTTLPPPHQWSEVAVAESRGERDRAAALVRAALTENPTDSILAIEAASFYDRAGEFDRADQLRAQVLARSQLEPDLVALAHERGARSWLERQQLDRAAHATRLALDVQADAATWRGQPYFQMGLAPSTSCRLRLLLADIELRAGRPNVARQLVAQVRDDCPGSETTRRSLRAMDLRLRSGS